MNGLYIVERANRMDHGDGCCSLCLGQIETIEHLLYQCLRAQCRWAGNTIYFEANPNQSFLVRTHSIINIINDSLFKTPHGMARLFVIFQII